MKYVFISDLHIKSADDTAANLLRKFFIHEKTQEADQVILLGDIFDLLIGEHKAYIDKYAFFFDGVRELLDQGKIVVFIEGNHDFHFSKIIANYFKINTKNFANFEYRTKGKEFQLGEKKYFYCHGYEVDYFNKYFKRWYRVYSSRAFNVFLSYVLTFSLIQWLGNWASQNSKKRGKKSFDHQSMKDKYLTGAKSLIDEKNFAGVIAGHTHIEEFHTYPDGAIYLNCGMPTKHNHFISVEDGDFKRIFF